MRHLKTTLLVVGTVTILALAGNTVALATTGQSLLLGKTNTANTVTVLKRTTSGTPLSINSASSANAPLAVNGTGKVTHLNADKLDGLDSTALQNTVWVWTHSQSTPGMGFTLTLPLPTGKYLLSYSARMLGAFNADVDCYFWKLPSGGGSLYFGESLFHSPAAQHPGLTGSGYVTKEAGAAVRLKCTSTVNFTTDASEPVQIVATRVDRVASNFVLRTATH